MKRYSSQNCARHDIIICVEDIITTNNVIYIKSGLDKFEIVNILNSSINLLNINNNKSYAIYRYELSSFVSISDYREDKLKDLGL